jgi:tetratricopeptide (TPR) repeat protein
MKKRSWIIAVLLAGSVVPDIRAEKEVDARLKVFANQKRQQLEELAAKLHLDVPAESREFFRAAEAGDWRTVSNSFERIRPVAGTNGPLPGLNNVLYVPIHETFGAYAEFNDWNREMLQKFGDGILHSIPTGSIYFGGTGSGRFVITNVRDVAQSPDIFILTQNGMGDGLYGEYLRHLYGSRIWVPNEKDVQQAFQEYVAQHRTAEARGVGGLMNIIGILTKAIFDHNKSQHEFYVQESFVIAWMYPYLEPHGMIMKLNKEPLTALDPAVVTRDRQFWDALTKELLADRHFTENAAARMTFSKLRSAIGGLYAYRRQMTNEAEAAFIQSRQLYPTSPEANFRLAQLYMEAGRFDDAIDTLRSLHQIEPREDERRKIQEAIKTINAMKQEAAGSQKP